MNPSQKDRGDILRLGDCKPHVHCRAAIYSSFLIPHNIKESCECTSAGLELSEALNESLLLSGPSIRYHLSYSWKSFLEGSQAARRRVARGPISPSIHNDHPTKFQVKPHWLVP